MPSRTTIPISGQPVATVFPKCPILGGEAVTANFKVLGINWRGKQTH